MRTPDPTGASDAISIMRSAELAGSDPELVGLMLRCGATDIEVLAVVIPPLPPRATPLVTLTAGTSVTRLEGAVTPPGSAIRLPEPATASAQSKWFGATSIGLEIAHADRTIRGKIGLDGLGPALAALRTACANR